MTALYPLMNNTQKTLSTI